MYRVFGRVDLAVRQEAFGRFKAAFIQEVARIAAITGTPPALRFPPWMHQDGIRRSCCPIGATIIVQHERRGATVLWGMVGYWDVPDFIAGATVAEATDFMLAWDHSVIGSMDQLAAAMGVEDAG